MADYHDTTHGPVVLWQFDGNINDSSGNGHHLSLQDGTERYADVVPGLRGFWFDGSTELRLSSPAALTTITGDITIEYIVVFDRTVGSEQSPVHPAKEEDPAGTGKNYTWYLSFEGSAMSFRWFHEYGSGVDVNHRINDGLLVGVPYHIAAVRESNVVTFYLNGRQIGASSVSLTAAEGGSTAFMLVGGESGVDRFKGVLASVKIIDSALSAGEVEAEFDATLGSFGVAGQGTANSPVALWHFDENLDDVSGNGYDLSVSSGTERYTDLIPGLRGALLDGSTILSRAYTAALHITGDITVECGFVPAVDVSLQDLIRFGGGTGQANNTAYALRVDGQGHLLGYLAESGNTPRTTTTYDIDDGLVVGTLYHLAMRRNSQAISFFVNGRLVGSTSAALTAPDGGGSGLMWIGFSSSEIVGGIAGVKIIASALSDGQIEDEAEAFFGE